MEQVNEVVNNVAACLGTVLPLEEASDALKRITASEKVLKAQASADNDEASIKTEYVSSNKRNEGPVSRVPSESSKSVHDIVNVSRSISHVSSVSVSSAPKNAEAEVPVARSRSSASIKTDAVSNTSTESNEDISEVEEESSDVDKTSSSILNQVKLIDLASESHIAVSYGSAEEEKTVIKNTQHKCWSKITKAIAVACILALVSYTVVTVGELNKIQSGREQFLANTDDEPTVYPTYYPTYMPTYAPSLGEEIVTRKPTLDEEIATGKDRKGKKEKKTATDQDPV